MQVKNKKNEDRYRVFKHIHFLPVNTLVVSYKIMHRTRKKVIQWSLEV
jgi:hypothetical protein